MAEQEHYLTAEEAARYLGVSKQTLYAYVSRGLVASEPAHVSGTRARRYAVRVLDDLKARRTERRDRGQGDKGFAPSALESAITLIEGGRLWYRGFDACELSRTSSFE